MTACGGESPRSGTAGVRDGRRTWGPSAAAGRFYRSAAVPLFSSGFDGPGPAVLFQLVMQGDAVDIENFGSARLVPVALFEHVQDVRFFHLFERPRATGVWGGAVGFEGEVVLVDL